MASKVGNTAEWQKFIFPGNISLTSGTTYWIVLHGEYTQSDDHHVTWRADTSSSAFAGGNIAKYNNGSWSTDTDDDFMFRLIEETAGTGYQTDSGTLTFDDDGSLTAVYYTNIKDTGGIDLYGVHVNYDASGLSSVLVEIRLSDDGSSFGAWQTWFPVDYSMRYYQIRITFTRATALTAASLNELSIVADQPA